VGAWYERGHGSLAATLLIAGPTAGMLAVARGDRPCSPSLNRWDEAAAYAVLVAVARVFA
jgi:hypothetical protein